MNEDCVKKPASVDGQEAGNAGSMKKTWAAPTLRVIRAGSAENTPGNSFVDGPLEGVGS